MNQKTRRFIYGFIYLYLGADGIKPNIEMLHHLGICKASIQALIGLIVSAGILWYGLHLMDKNSRSDESE